MLRHLLSATLMLLITSAHAQSALPIDTDGDGLLDLQEDPNENLMQDEGETHLFKADTDGGGEADGSEVQAGRNPFDPSDDMTFDEDGDGLPNFAEILQGTNPKLADTDGDGVIDSEDLFPLDARYARDNDDDLIADEWEEEHGLNIEEADDAEEDSDGDGLTNIQEFSIDTDPQDEDSDDDGVTDTEEINQGSNPKETPCLVRKAITSPFVDIDGHWAKSFIESLQGTELFNTKEPIIKGYTSGGKFIFNPDAPITRFELLKIATFGACLDVEEIHKEDITAFTDLLPLTQTGAMPDATQRMRVISTAIKNDIARGYEDQTFKPDAKTNRAEAIKILLRAAGKDVPEGGTLNLPSSDIDPDAWYIPYLQRAIEENIIQGYSDGTFRMGKPITRAEAAKLVYFLLTSKEIY